MCYYYLGARTSRREYSQDGAQLNLEDIRLEPGEDQVVTMLTTSSGLGLIISANASTMELVYFRGKLV